MKQKTGSSRRIGLAALLAGWMGMGAHAALAHGETLTCPEAKPSLNLFIFGDSRTPYYPLAKGRILQAAEDEKPDVIVHVGDMVQSSHERYWRWFDREEGRLRRPGVSFLPVFGNHEARTAEPGSPADPFAPYFARFPELRGSAWYEFRCGPLVVLTLNSEESLAQGDPQRRWLEERLQAPPLAPGEVRIVLMHRPLMTARPTYAHRNAGELIPLFTQAVEEGRLSLVFSGHTHNYERLPLGGKGWSVVSGGGGSETHAFAERLKEDRFIGPEPNFHYLRLKLEAGRAVGEMVRFDLDSEQFEVKDRFRVDPP
ncbi:MAG: metallophosphoesterase [Magnetococcales bacterium]|nr:metallophosphoesterase [Magnetococcales bacterium]